LRKEWASFVHYKADSLNGKCVVAFPNKNRIEYLYEKDLKQGAATKFFSNGSKLHYLYKDNMVVGPGKFVDSKNNSGVLTLEQITRVADLANPTLAEAIKLLPIPEETSPPLVPLIESDYFN
jgi:antitoxin component YwqK of YwqJK toxin-antitoxin module